MKKLFLLFVMCFVSMMMPQRMQAADVYSSETLTITTSEDGKTVTISSQQAGALWALLEKGTPQVKDPVIAAIKAVTGEGSKIVFSGEFSGDDLQSLSKPGNNNCCVQETVDMANTTFKKHADLTEAMEAYKINVKPHDLPQGVTPENATAEQINEALNAEAQNQGITPVNGDVAVFNNSFYQYNGSSWEKTTQPFFASKERMEACINGGPAWEKYAGAMVDGNPTIFQYKQDPTDYQNKWVQLSSDHAYDDMTFKYWGSYVKTAISSNNAGSDLIATGLCNNCSNLTNLTIGSGTVYSITDQGNKPPLKDLTIGNKVVRLGSSDQGAQGVFSDYTTITNLTFSSGGNDPLVIARDCFQRCSGFTTVSIPARATLIETGAFDNCAGLKTVIFEPTTQPAAPLVIKYEAFQNSTAIRDVYVNVNPALKTLVCEYNAFDFNVQDAQSQVTGYNNMATLHFDEGDTEFYKGEWKEGLGFSQIELMAIRGEDVNASQMIRDKHIGIDFVEDNPKLVDNQNNPVTYSEYTYTQGYLADKRPANGWQQFAKTGNEIPVTGNFIRSYSRYNPADMPTYYTSGKPLVKIYRIWNFDDGYTEGADIIAENTIEKKAYAKEVKDYIPGNTGLIMVGIADQAILYNFKAYSGGGTTRQYPFNDNTTAADAEDECNLLEGNPNSDVDLAPTITANQTLYRIFGFRASDKKFLRAQPGTVLTKNHAFMKLKNDLFHWKNEKGGTSSDGIGSESSNSKISFIYFLDEEEEFGGIATVIRKAIEEADMEEGEFYTLQGVKVNKPTTKGVYIHNGKKVLVK